MIFKKKKKTSESANDKPGLRDTVANKVVSGITKVQNGFAFVMGRWVNGLSINGKKIFITLFCLVFGGYSLYVIIDVLIDNDKSLHTLKPKGISVPKHYDNPGEETKFQDVTITEAEFNKIKNFRLYMDSLQSSAKGKLVYDSIMRFRPGLLDSVKMLEQIYFSQQQNK